MASIVWSMWSLRLSALHLEDQLNLQIGAIKDILLSYMDHGPFSP